MTDKATPSLRQRCDTALQSLPDAAYKTMLAALFDDLLGLAAQAAPTDAYERTTQPSLATDYEAHQKNGLAWAVNSWMLEVKNRPLINVHRRTLDDTWRQVIRYFGGNPDSLIGPSHDALMDAEPKRNGRPISWGEEPAQSAQAPAQAVQDGPERDMITQQQALEALDELEGSARGDEPFNHFAAPLLRQYIEQGAQPGAAKSLNAMAADLLRPYLKPGQKVIWRESFRWHDDNGVLSNHYDGMELEQLSDAFGYDWRYDMNLKHAAIVWDKVAAPQPQQEQP